MLARNFSPFLSTTRGTWSKSATVRRRENSAYVLAKVLTLPHCKFSQTAKSLLLTLFISLCSDPINDPYPRGLSLLNDELGVLLRIDVILTFVNNSINTEVFINDVNWKEHPKTKTSDPSFGSAVLDDGEIILNKTTFVKRADEADFKMEKLESGIRELRPIFDIELLEGFKCQQRGSIVAN